MNNLDAFVAPRIENVMLSDAACVKLHQTPRQKKVGVYVLGLHIANIDKHIARKLIRNDPGKVTSETSNRDGIELRDHLNKVHGWDWLHLEDTTLGGLRQMHRDDHVDPDAIIMVDHDHGEVKT